MNKFKTKISIFLAGLLCVAIINDNIKSDAFHLADLNNKINSNQQQVALSEYDISEADNELININNISIETAVDNSCEYTTSIEVTEEHHATGSITQINEDYNITTEVASESSEEFTYLGQVDSQGNVVNSASDNIGVDRDYYVENWEELPGDLVIKVNKQASCVTVYKGDVPIRAMVCSAGESTPEGTFYMQSKWDWLLLIKGQYGRYCSQISGDYLFHSVPYNSMDIYDLDTEMYNQLGTLCSHGCIRLQVEDAKWIYDNCTTGVEIIIYSDENPGPMEKPGFEQIPDSQTYDPTDIDIE